MVAIDHTSCGPCGNVLCPIYGCQKQNRIVASPALPGHCYYPVMTPPQGCICPPTSEQTCQNPACPRKPRVEVRP
jgi:hypothetical protein